MSRIGVRVGSELDVSRREERKRSGRWSSTITHVAVMAHHLLGALYLPITVPTPPGHQHHAS